MNLFELYAKISVDDTNFKQSMENAQKVSKNVATAMQQLQSPLDKAKNTFNAIAHPIEAAKANFEKLKNATEAIRHPIETFKSKVADASAALETKRNKLSALSAAYDSAKKKVADITKEFNKSAKESGTSSQKTQELAKKLNEAEKEAEEAKKELDDYSASVSKAGKNSESAKDKISKLSKGLGTVAKVIGNGLVTAAKIGTAAVGAAAAGITALTTAAVNNYAEYEQLVGGAELMFGGAFKTVMQNSKEAYKTVQMSQNEYLQQVNGFATGLKTALGGNEQAAADLAHKIIQAEADVVAATGNSQEAVQNAFNGIMKSNFTMLDNLQIGITPTKEGFQEVIDKVNDWNKANGEATNYQMDNLADMQSALVDYIDMVGMSGYAQAEAAGTISGSIASMKSAWSNLVTGLADNEADIDSLMDGFVDSAVNVVKRIAPKIGTALKGIAKVIKEVVPVAMEYIPQIISEFLPTIAEAAVGIVTSIGTAIFDNIDQILEWGQQMLNSLFDGITNNADNIADVVAEVITKFGTFILENLPEIVMAGLTILGSLISGLIEAIPELATAATKAVIELVSYLISEENLEKLKTGAVDLLNALIEGFKNILELLAPIGEDIVDGIKQGISDAWDALVSWFNGLWDSLFGDRTVSVSVKTSHSGSGGNFANGLDYVPYDGFYATLHKGERVLTASENKEYSGGASGNTSGITIIQNIQSVPQTPVELAAATSAYFEQARWAF